MMVKRALISVYDKTGITEFAKGLAALGIEIISTGGTAKALAESGVNTIEVQDLTGFPECLDGRVKTLHPKIHGGLLAVRSNASHMKQMQANGVGLIDLVVCNLYPFKQTMQKAGAAFDDIIEQIDIGGPAMLRSSAKNFRDVAVITDPADYGVALGALQTFGDIPLPLKFELARKVFEYTAGYDALIAGFFERSSYPGGGDALEGADAGLGGAILFPQTLTLTFEKMQQMRYGENPHQGAAFYADPIPAAGSLATFRQLHGKELSYNNIGDLDGALSLLAEFHEPAAVAVKHANPCGAAIGQDIYDAYMKAYECDKVSIYGGIVVLNRTVDARTATAISKLFIEVLAAPAYDEDALKILSKKRNIRIMIIDTGAAAIPAAAAAAASVPASAAAARDALYIKKVGGGLLVQTNDNTVLDMSGINTVTLIKPTDAQLADLVFAMAVVKHTKSNAIVLAKGGATIGVGPGQNSRIMATKIAIEVAGDRSLSSVAASDAYFPFEDCVEALAAAGVSAIIQPGGSKNDQLSIDACNRHKIAMVFTGMRHFMH